MTILSEIERRAWDLRMSAKDHQPAMACKAAADQIDAGKLGTVRHVIVVVVENIGGDDCIHLIQAGDMSDLAAEGALNRAIRVSTNKE